MAVARQCRCIGNHGQRAGARPPAQRAQSRPHTARGRLCCGGFRGSSGRRRGHSGPGGRHGRGGRVDGPETEPGDRDRTDRRPPGRQAVLRDGRGDPRGQRAAFARRRLFSLEPAEILQFFLGAVLLSGGGSSAPAPPRRPWPRGRSRRPFRSRPPPPPSCYRWRASPWPSSPPSAGSSLAPSTGSTWHAPGHDEVRVPVLVRVPVAESQVVGGLGGEELLQVVGIGPVGIAERRRAVEGAERVLGEAGRAGDPRGKAGRVGHHPVRVVDEPPADES